VFLNFGCRTSYYNPSSINDESNNLISQLHGIVESCSSGKLIKEIISESEKGIADLGFSSKDEFYSYMEKQRFPSEKVFCVTLKDLEYKKLVVSEGLSKLIDLKHGLYIRDKGYDTIIANDQLVFENFDELYQQTSSSGKQPSTLTASNFRIQMF